MTMSSLALLPLLLASAPAGPATAEEALENYRQRFKPTKEIDCPPGEDPEVITVCGRQGLDPYRLPLPVSGPPRAADRAGGEQLSAMNSGPGSCTPVGRDQRCNGGLPVIPIIMTAIKAAEKLLRPE